MGFSRAFEIQHFDFKRLNYEVTGVESNNDVLKVLDDILSDKDSSAKLVEIKDYHELYSLYLAHGGNEDLSTFIKCINEFVYKRISELELGEDDILNVAGGKGGIKLAAGLLAGLTALSSASVGASNANLKKPSNSVGVVQKSKNFVKNHPLITTGAVLGVPISAVGLGLLIKSLVEHSKENPSQVDDKNTPNDDSWMPRFLRGESVDDWRFEFNMMYELSDFDMVNEKIEIIKNGCLGEYRVQSRFRSCSNLHVWQNSSYHTMDIEKGFLSVDMPSNLNNVDPEIEKYFTGKNRYDMSNSSFINAKRPMIKNYKSAVDTCRRAVKEALDSGCDKIVFFAPKIQEGWDSLGMLFVYFTFLEEMEKIEKNNPSSKLGVVIVDSNDSENSNYVGEGIWGSCMKPCGCDTHMVR